MEYVALIFTILISPVIVNHWKKIDANRRSIQIKLMFLPWLFFFPVALMPKFFIRDSVLVVMMGMPWLTLGHYFLRRKDFPDEAPAEDSANQR